MANEQTLVQEQTGNDYCYPTEADLSALQYTYVKLSSNKVVAAGAGDAPLGILQNAPLGTAAAPKTAVVRLFGASKLKFGGTVAQGNFLKSNASGQGIAVTAQHDQYGAEAKTAGVSGDLGLVVIVRGKATQTD